MEFVRSGLARIRRDELDIASDDRRTAGRTRSAGSPRFSEIGTDRELGMATSTLMPMALSIAAMVSPVLASARLSTKCHAARACR